MRSRSMIRLKGEDNKFPRRAPERARRRDPAKLAKAREIAERAESENRAMTDEEQKSYDETMAEGLVPARTLREPLTYDPARQVLLGRLSGRALALGDRVSVELTEADVLTGQLAFRLVEHTPGAAAHAAGRRRGKGRK